MITMDSFYGVNELAELGLKTFGRDVSISRKCSIYGAENISIGNNVRIDDFCLLCGKIEIGNHVHISAYSALYGAGGIKIGNFCGVSPRSTILSATDDFSGEFMISPLVPDKLTNLKKALVVMRDYSQLGAETTVMPGVVIGEGAVTGAKTLVRHDLDDWTINVGVPARKLKKREQKVKELSMDLL
jgi:galactoside O-acetyltransferase